MALSLSLCFSPSPSIALSRLLLFKHPPSIAPSNRIKKASPLVERQSVAHSRNSPASSKRDRQRMASSLALRRAAAATATAAASSGLLSRLSNPLRAASVAPHVARSIKTSSRVQYYDEDDSDVEVKHHIEVEGGSDHSATLRRWEPGLFSDVFDPLSPTWSLNQVVNLMDQLLGTEWRRGWDVKEYGCVLFLRLDMPGLGREDVKVSVEHNTLTIKDKGEKELEEGEESRRYSSRLSLPPNLYKLGEIRAEMKNGVLKLVVPKVMKEEKWNGVYPVR